jgi:hypothetical protein
MTKKSILAFAFVGLMILPSLGLLNSETVAAQPSGDSAGAWRLVRTPNPRGGPDAVSVMHTADPSRSDLDFAGLMIRCSQEGSELAIVLLNPFPLQARPHVTFGKPGRETQLQATIGAPGTTVVLKGDPKSILGEAWSAEGDLSVRVTDGPKSISGVVPLGGIQPAFAQLKANCPTP